jgi:phospholipase/carboxylesterase
MAAIACDDRRPMPAGRTVPEFVAKVIPARVGSSTPGPLLVLLHGIGADEHDLAGLAPALDPRFTIVSLRAPRPYQVGHAWFDLAFRPDGTVIPDLEQARETLADLVRWLEGAPERFGTDPSRLYLLGFSQGSMMSLGVLHAAPARLAGVVALSGRFSDQMFATTTPRDAIAGVPVFLAHGTLDDVLPIANGRSTRDYLQPLLRNLTYREYPIGHGISPEELRTIDAWLRERLS